MKSSELWSEAFGFLPHKILVFENAAKAGTLYLRWRADGNWKWKSLGMKLRDERGRILPERRRMALAEMRKLLEVAPEIDPRFALLLAFGADLRLGQVLRCRRSDVSTEHRTLTVRSAGRKRGTVVELTAGQWAAWERAIAPTQLRMRLSEIVGGYLCACEAALPDYPLFPRGRLKKGTADPATHGRAGPIDRSAVRKWFDMAEAAAGIPHVAGRGAYGLRRVAVDSAKEGGISREGLQALGGWTTSAMADEIYADQSMTYARKEAAKHRAAMRGEK